MWLPVSYELNQVFKYYYEGNQLVIEAYIFNPVSKIKAPINSDFWHNSSEGSLYKSKLESLFTTLEQYSIHKTLDETIDAEGVSSASILLKIGLISLITVVVFIGLFILFISMNSN